MAAYTVDQLYDKLERADAAGDAEAARAIADEIRRVQGAQPAVTPAAEPAAETPKTLGELTRQAVSELGGDIVDAGRALPEGVRRAATGLGQLGSYALPGKLGDWSQAGLSDFSQSRQREFAESELGQSFPGKVGAFVGEVGVTAPMGYAGIAPKGSGIIRHMAQGGAAGYGMGLATEGTPDQKLNTAMLSGLAGTLVPGAMIGGQNALGWARKKLAPSPGMAAREVGELLESAADNLPLAKDALTREAPIYVPGSLPTAAEYTGDVGWQALQNTVKGRSNQFRDFINNRDAMTDEARERYIRELFEGADDASYKAIKAARDGQGAIDRLGLMDVTGINVKPVARYIAGQLAAQDNRVVITNILKPITGELLRRDVPEAARRANAASLVRGFVQSRGNQLPANVRQSLLDMADGKPTGLGSVRASQDPGVQSLMRGYKAVLSRETKNIDDFHRLYNARKTLNDWIEMKGGSDTDAQRMRLAGAELRAIRDRLDEQIVRVAPEFSEYLTAFSAASRRMEQNRAGKELLGTRGAGKPLGQRTANMADDPDELARLASNNDQSTAAGTFTAGQRQGLDNLLADIVRQQGPKGKGNYVMADEGPGIGSAYTLSGPVGIAANRMLNDVRSKHGALVADTLAKALESPQNMVAALAKLPPAWRRKYMRATLPALGITVTTKLINDIERESRYPALPAYGEP